MTSTPNATDKTELPRVVTVTRKETEQREALQRRLGTRTAPRERSDMGSPMLNEETP